MTAKQLNAHERIQKGMLTAERLLLAAIRKANRKGEGWHMFMNSTLPTHHAMDRLWDKKLITFNRRGSWRNDRRRGYWTTKEWAKEWARAK